MNRPSLPKAIWFTSRRDSRRLNRSIVGGFGFRWRNISNGLIYATIVEPVEPGELDRVELPTSANNDCTDDDQVGSSAGRSETAAIASLASAGRDLAPVFFMMDARWFSTVRWLI